MNIQTAIRKGTIQFSKTFSTLENCKALIESYAIDELGLSIEKAKAFALSVAKESSIKLLSTYHGQVLFVVLHQFHFKCLKAKDMCNNINIQKLATFTPDAKKLQLVVFRLTKADNTPYNFVWIMGNIDKLKHKLFAWNGTQFERSYFGQYTMPHYQKTRPALK